MIFTPYRLSTGLTLKNRLVLAPMTTWSSLPDGSIHPEELAYLQRRAEGGLGMLMTAACYVHRNGKAFDGQWSCSKDEDLPSLRATAEAIQRGGAVAVNQIHHGGRMCPGRLCGGEPVSASAVKADRPNADVPRALTGDEVEELVQAFADGARRSKEAGFDGVEIHGANTYLLQQFVSPMTNLRDDYWGEDRNRFPLAVLDAVRSAVGPDFPVGYRFSPEETEPEGIQWEHTQSLLEALMSRPLQWLHISLREFRSSSMRGEFDEPVLRRVHRLIGGRVPLIGVGAIRTLEEAEEALADCELVALGRVAVSEPEWGTRALAGEPIRTRMPVRSSWDTLTIPAGLQEKIAAVPGWFEQE